MSMWKLINTTIYRLYYGYRGRKIQHESWMPILDVHEKMQDEVPPILYVAWGRIGDLLLATGHLKHFRKWFHPHPIWVLGRPEVESIVAPYVDVFIPLKEGNQGSSSDADEVNGQILNRPFELVISDVHMFYGGVFFLGSLLEKLDARGKYIYEGYYLGDGLAPLRSYPAGYRVIPRMPDEPIINPDITLRHVLHHMKFYIEEILKSSRTDYEGFDILKPELSCSDLNEDVSIGFGLEPGQYIAWQPVSNNPKKDYPLDRWFEVIAAFPEQTFVALGSKKEQKRLAGKSAENLINLCGNTTLDETAMIISQAGLFAGLDSGLSHMASLLGVPTVCVSQNSNLGYFFPYPTEYGFTNQEVVYHPDYINCSGCFMTCEYESIFSTYRKGALCLRSLPVDPVITAIRKLIG